MKHFSYAVQVQPQTGQELLEFPNGCDLEDPRRLTAQELAANPQAIRQAGPEDAAVIDAQREVYLVPEAEMDD